MMSSRANANSAKVDRSGAQTDPGLADTLPPDAVEVLTFFRVDIDLDIAPQADAAVNLDLDLDEVASSDRPVAPAVDFIATAAPAVAADWADTARPLLPSWADKRVMVVSTDESERTYLRARLALAHLVWVDEAATTTQALAALAVRPYAMAFVNLDSVAIDGGAIAARLRAGNPSAALVLTSSAVSGGHPFNLLARWRRWQLGRHLGHDHNAEVLAKPLEPRAVIELLSRLTTPLVV